MQITIAQTASGRRQGGQAVEAPPPVQVTAAPTMTVVQLQRLVDEKLGRRVGALRQSDAQGKAGPSLTTDRARSLDVLVGPAGSEPCYDAQAGLRIPSDMTLVRFYNSFMNRREAQGDQAPQGLSAPQSTVEVRGGRLQFPGGASVNFQRTLRVPETDKQYPLPPGMGHLRPRASRRLPRPTSRYGAARWGGVAYVPTGGNVAQHVVERCRAEAWHGHGERSDR